MLTIPIAFAFHELTWPQLYVVSFLLGTANLLLRQLRRLLPDDRGARGLHRR
jgi:hypothetical protein